MIFSWFKKDIDTPSGLRHKINKLRKYNNNTELTDLYTDLSRQRGYNNSSNVWYSDQGEHWDGWLKGYSGSGFYARKNHNRTSEYVYNQINCPEMLIWLVESAGIDKTIIQSAIDKSIDNPKFQSRCKIIREEIPWTSINVSLKAFD